MKKIAVAGLITAIIAIAACTTNRSAATSGVPNPPFQGEPPQEAYVYNGPTGAYGGRLVLATPDDLTSYNIIRATDNATADVIWFNVFRCLVDYRNGADPPDYDPGVCTRWEQSPDAKQWTFHLRRGVSWSDGAPFTADDVVFTYDVVRDPNVQTPVRDMFREGRDAGGNPLYPDLVKLDDHTVRFDLHNPSGSFLDLVFNLWLIPKHKWEGQWRAGGFNEAMKLGLDVPRDLYRDVAKIEKKLNMLAFNPQAWRQTTLIYSLEALLTYLPADGYFDFAEADGCVYTVTLGASEARVWHGCVQLPPTALDETSGNVGTGPRPGEGGLQHEVF